MSNSEQLLTPAQTAKRLGVSQKALRMYEQRQLLTPLRSEAGWRYYNAAALSRAETIITFRSLGLSLSEIKSVLDGDLHQIEVVLAEHSHRLNSRIQELANSSNRVGRLRGRLAKGDLTAIEDGLSSSEVECQPVTSFKLPWPWAGQRYKLRQTGALNFITGPLGSGKTIFARSIAEALPGAAFVELDRCQINVSADDHRRSNKLSSEARVEEALRWILAEGGNASDPLVALLLVLGMAPKHTLVIDMIEQDLCERNQIALMSYLRFRAPARKPLFLSTRSDLILDLGSVRSDETITYCPPNHAMPISVEPFPGTTGYESVASCVAPPKVRARTEGIVACRPDTKLKVANI